MKRPAPSALPPAPTPSEQAPDTTEPPELPPHVVDVADLATYLGIPRNTVYQWRARGKLPAPDRFIGRNPVWWPETIRRWQNPDAPPLLTLDHGTMFDFDTPEMSLTITPETPDGFTNTGWTVWAEFHMDPGTARCLTLRGWSGWSPLPTPRVFPTPQAALDAAYRCGLPPAPDTTASHTHVDDPAPEQDPDHIPQ